MPEGLLFLDCDSTLSSIEGVDELARARGPEVMAAVARLTNDAMEGRVDLDSIFGSRLEQIRPTRAECARVATLYRETVAPGAASALKTAASRGWHLVMVSGGFAPCVADLAADLGITAIEAVPLYFDAAGNYAGFDRHFPTTRNGGKPEVVRRWRARHPNAKTALVGDGVSDLEAKGEVDVFFGFGGFVERKRVRREADVFLRSFSDLPGLLPPLDG